MQNKEKFNMVSISEVANLGSKYFFFDLYGKHSLPGRSENPILINPCESDIPRVCHLQSENGALWDSIFRCKYAIFLVFTGLENF